MPLHDDEMKKRREKREAQRKKQKAESRRLKITLLLAAVVLVLAVAGIGKIVEKADFQAPATQQAPVKTETVTKPTEPPRRTEVNPLTTIHIKAAGDLNVTNSVVDAGLSTNGYNYSRRSLLFQHIAPLYALGRGQASVVSSSYRHNSRFSF